MARSTSSRFDPPPLEIDGDTLWILRRAFGPPEIDAPVPSGENLAAHAATLGVAARVASRVSRERLAAELGEAGASAFADEGRRAVETSLAYDALAETLVRHARDLGYPLVFLKGYALHRAGIAAPGSRLVGDLDVLVARPQARRLQEALVAAGFRPAAGEGNEQHLPPLAAPGWGIVDLHHALRGVCDDSGGWLGADAVARERGAVEVIPGGWIPSPTSLAAHALARAIEQHGNNPRPYPLLRMVADLQDLLPDGDGWDGAMPSLESSLGPTLDASEIESARDLTLLLSAGEPPSDSGAGPGRLLAHFLAHATDSDYRRSLGSRHLRHRLGQARRRGTLVRYASRKLQDLWRRAVTR